MPEPFCDGEIVIDWNGGTAYIGFDTDHLLFQYDPAPTDPTPQVSVPRASHNFGLAASPHAGPPESDVRPNLSYWQRYEQAASENATLTLDEFNAVEALNQPGVSVNFDDSSPADVPNISPSDFSSDNSSFDLGIPAVDTVGTIALNTDYNSGDTNSPVNVSVGEPINSATGNVFQTQRDYIGLGPFPLRFLRFYNSQIHFSAAQRTELGTNWRGSYDSAIAVVSGFSVPTAIVARPDGQTLGFTNLSSGNQWVSADPTVRSTLTSQTDSSGNIIGWMYSTADDFKEAYNAAGQLLSITNRAGFSQTLAYNSSNQLASVSDPYGHQLLMSYNGQGQLVLVTDPAGGTYSYTYDANNNLTAVTYPDHTTRQYVYENTSFPHAMTGLIDENGTRFVSWVYDSQGRATLSKLAGGVMLDHRGSLVAVV